MLESGGVRGSVLLAARLQSPCTRKMLDLDYSGSSTRQEQL